MTKYLIRRLLAMAPVMLFLSIIVFSLMRLLPGDPILVLIGRSEADVAPEVVEQLRDEYGLNDPFFVQYFTWIGDILTGDFGQSVQTRQPVLDTISSRLLPTGQIALMALVFGLMIALPTAIMSAVSPNSRKDWFGTIGALFGAAIPYFLLAGILIYVVGLRLRWLPASGYVSLFEDPVQSIKHTLLPSITLSVGFAAVVTRQARSSLVEVLQETYIMAARARGLTERRVILVHAFNNGMLPVVTIIGIYLGRLFGGAVIIETIFAVPGMGRLLVDSIFSRDYAVVQAIVLFIGIVVVIANLVTDLVYAYLDPRIRY